MRVYKQGGASPFLLSPSTGLICIPEEIDDGSSSAGARWNAFDRSGTTCVGFLLVRSMFSGAAHVRCCGIVVDLAPSWYRGAFALQSLYESRAAARSAVRWRPNLHFA